MMMAELLALADIQAPSDPALIFETIAHEVPLYAGLDYDAIGLLGLQPSQTPQEVLR
jgi:hypothetical protein